MGELRLCLYTLLDVFLSPMTLMAGDGLRNEIRNWCHDNYKRTIDQAADKLEARGYRNKKQIRYPSNKFIYDLANGASSEDNPDLQVLWATLLANEADPSFEEDIDRKYFSIIKDISTIDVQVIKELRTQSKKRPGLTFDDDSPDVNYVNQFAFSLKIPHDKIKISFFNLIRLGLVDITKSIDVITSNDGSNILSVYVRELTYAGIGKGEVITKKVKALTNKYPYFTELGSAFIKACFDDAENSNTESSE